MSSITSKNYILFSSFVSGFTVMLVEICGVRLLGPYFGTSIIVWTNILSVILVALSFGSIYSSKIQKRLRQGSDGISQILIYAGILIVLIPLLSDYISLFAFYLFHKNVVLLVFLGSLLSSILNFGLQFFILGMISPYLISYLNSVNPENNNAGIIISLSTLGGLVGTLLPTALIIPLLGTKFCVTLAGILLVTTGMLRGIKKKELFVVIFLVLFTNFSPKIHAEGVIQKESRQQYISISSIEGINYLSIDSGLGFQSVYNPNSVMTNNYYDYVNLLPELVQSKEPVKILIIGLAGGTTARELVSNFGDQVEIDGVENDPAVIDLSKKYMGLSEKINIVTQDGRVFLNTSSKKYDVVYIDAFSNEFQIPWHLTTLEFWSLVSKHLNDGGVVGMNIFSLKKYGGRLSESISATGKSVFNHVYNIPVKETDGTNILLIMSGREVNLKNISSKNPDIEKINTESRNSIVEILEPKQKILTDNSSPVELLTVLDLLE